MRTVRDFLIASTLALPACDSLTETSGPPPVPTGQVSFIAPAGGESYQMGDTVLISWECDLCQNIPEGDFVRIGAYDGADVFLVAIGGELTDSLSWEVGSTADSTTMLPGFYVMLVEDNAGSYFSQSRYFELVAAP